VGERVNKIRFVGSINKETRVRQSVTYQTLGKERSRTREKRREGELRFSAAIQVRVRLMIK